MREVTIYVADDGTRFDSRDDCAKHEAALSVPSEIKVEVRSCNRHEDCDAADARARERGRHWANHCHDDCCEDCFGC